MIGMMCTLYLGTVPTPVPSCVAILEHLKIHGSHLILGPSTAPRATPERKLRNHTIREIRERQMTAAAGLPNLEEDRDVCGGRF